MLDLKNIFKKMEAPLAEYCQVTGVDNAHEDLVSPEPRLIYQASPDTTKQDKPMQIGKKEVLSDDPEFEYDIEYTYVSYPKVKLKISSTQIDQGQLYLAKAQQWFEISQFGRRFFDNYQIVIKEIGDIQLIEDNSETKVGFTAVLQIKEVIKVREKTIEALELAGFDDKKIITKY